MEEIEVTIHDVAFGGSGVGRLPDGKIVFVPYTLVGEKIQVRINRSKKDFSEAELIRVISPSPYRTHPPCIYFGQCGGCQYQHTTYEEQFRIKKKQVCDTLERIGSVKELPDLHFEPASHPFGYRNKISVHKGTGNNIGFFARDHHTILDIEKCSIASDALNAQLSSLRKTRSQFSHRSLVDPSLRSGIPEGSFHQINTEMASKLLDWLRATIEVEKEFRLLDLYCGTGFFALGLAHLFSQICGIDRDEHAIHAATSRAHTMGISGASFFAAPVEKQIDWIFNNTPREKTVLLVDPPREGLPIDVVEHLAKNPCAYLIYVSCNPTTLARDLKRLFQIQPKGYQFHSLGIFDMFPQTSHIETVAILRLT